MTAGTLIHGHKTLLAQWRLCPFYTEVLPSADGCEPILLGFHGPMGTRMSTGNET